MNPMETLSKTFALISKSSKNGVSSSQPTAVARNENSKSEFATQKSDSVSSKESDAEITEISPKKKMHSTLESGLPNGNLHESVMVSKLLQCEIRSFYL